MIQRFKNFIHSQVEKIKNKKGLKDVDIYSNMNPPMSKTNFSNHINQEGRETSPSEWPRFRRAMNLKRVSFWRDAMDWYDPEE